MASFYVRRIDCLDNLGSIHFEDVKFGRAISPIQFGDGVLIARCSVVTFTRCELWGMGPPITLQDSNVFVVETLFRQGRTTVGWIPADETLWCDQGVDLTLVDCRVRGADGYVPPYQCSPTLWADSAIRMSGGTLRVSGDSEIVGGDASSALSLCTWIEPAIIGTGTVLLDPRVRVQQTNGVYTNPGRHPQAALTSGIAVAGSRIDLTLYAPPRATAWLFVSAPMPQPIPLPWGNVWLDPRPGAAAHLAAAGVVDLQGLWTRTLPIFLSAPHGRPIMFQAIVLPHGGGTFEITTPTVSIVR